MFCSTEATVYMISSRLWGNTSPSVLCRRRSPHSPPWCRCMTSTRTKMLPGSRRPSKLKVRAQPATCGKFPHITVGVPPMTFYWGHTVWITGRELKHFTVGWIWTSRGSTLNSPLSLRARSLISSVTVRYQITVWHQSTVSGSSHTSVFSAQIGSWLKF